MSELSFKEKINNQKELWNKDAQASQNKLEQIHFFGINYNPYDSIYNELNYYLNFNNNNILEVGCGNGLILEKILLNSSNNNIFGVDISDKLILECQKSFSEIKEHFFTCDAEKLPFNDKEFDIVFSNSIFQYFPDESYTNRAILEMLRVCKPKGKIFIGDIYNKRYKNIYEKYYNKVSIAEKLKKYIKNILNYIKLRNYYIFEYNYIEPDYFIENYKNYGKIYLTLIWSKKPELFRQFRYNVIIEKYE